MSARQRRRLPANVDPRTGRIRQRPCAGAFVVRNAKVYIGGKEIGTFSGYYEFSGLKEPEVNGELGAPALLGPSYVTATFTTQLTAEGADALAAVLAPGRGEPAYADPEPVEGTATDSRGRVRRARVFPDGSVVVDAADGGEPEHFYCPGSPADPNVSSADVGRSSHATDDALEDAVATVDLGATHVELYAGTEADKRAANVLREWLEGKD
jgi:hypothetical protein